MGENESKVTVDWSPNRQFIALSRTGDALGADREEVLFIGKIQVIFVPSPSLESIIILPPSNSVIPLIIGKPKPVP
jgi:hypothetical protein